MEGVLPQEGMLTSEGKPPTCVPLLRALFCLATETSRRFHRMLYFVSLLVL